MKTIEQKKQEASIEKITNDNGKFNFARKDDGSIVSDIWFDSVITWSHYSRDENIDIFGWCGLVHLETPFKTSGAYPYCVLAKIYEYSSDGELLSVDEGYCGIWANEY